MRFTYKSLLVGLLLIFGVQMATAQYSDEYTGGLKMSLNEDGSKYVRILMWHQAWATFTGDDNGGVNTDFMLRRSRFLAFAQISKRFIILTHFGLNNMGPGQMGTAAPVPSGSGNGRFFMHDAWGEFAVVPGYLHVGGGLHYWNGYSRLNNQSTLNFLTLDAPGHNWSNIGTSDQFARHLGFYAKGRAGKLEYRFSVNEAIDNPLLGGSMDNILMGDSIITTNKAVYRNPNDPGGGKVVTGYVNYQFLDKEGNTLPFYVGTYMGKKRIFNVGAGFFHHREGAAYFEDGTTNFNDPTLVNPTSLAVDVFAEMPIGKDMGFTGYASFVNHGWGPNLTGGLDEVGTGNILYAQAGIALPEIEDMMQVQPYVHYTHRDLEAFEDMDKSTSSRLGVGANFFLEGHNLKITAEYQFISPVSSDAGNVPTSDLFRVQFMTFL